MLKNKTILVTGACGYIGSHTCVALAEAGYSLVALDNLRNSSRTALQRVERIIERSIPFFEADVRDRSALDATVQAHPIDAVIHFAGLKSVGESIAQPLAYFDNNLSGTVTLLQALQASRDIRLRSLEAVSQFQAALADLERAIGAPLP